MPLSIVIAYHTKEYGDLMRQACQELDAALFEIEMEWEVSNLSLRNDVAGGFNKLVKGFPNHKDGMTFLFVQGCSSHVGWEVSEYFYETCRVESVVFSSAHDRPHYPILTVNPRATSVVQRVVDHVRNDDERMKWAEQFMLDLIVRPVTRTKQECKTPW